MTQDEILLDSLINGYSRDDAFNNFFTMISNSFNTMIDQIELGERTKDEVWRSIRDWRLYRNNQFTQKTKNSTCDIAMKDAFEAAYQKALERLRAIPTPPPAATPPQLLRPTTKVVGTEPAPDVQAPAQGAVAVSKTDPVKETIRWLKNTDRQYIIKYTEPETPVMQNGALSHIKPPVSEWRIAKPAAFIYRELMNATENSIISLGKNAIADFMINNLKKKDGKDITIDSLIKAKERTKSDKSRQIPTK